MVKGLAQDHMVVSELRGVSFISITFTLPPPSAEQKNEFVLEGMGSWDEQALASNLGSATS